MLSDWAVWSIVEQSSKQIGVEQFGAHDLRPTCAKLRWKNGGDLEQIKFLPGHSSIQTHRTLSRLRAYDVSFSLVSRATLVARGCYELCELACASNLVPFAVDAVVVLCP